MSGQHSPLPWHVGDDGAIYDANGYEVCDPTQGPHLHENHDGDNGHWASIPGSHVNRGIDEEFESAHKIVGAVNSHAALVNALQQVAILGHGKCTIGKPLAEMIRAALAHAQGGGDE